MTWFLWLTDSEDSLEARVTPEGTPHHERR